MKKVFVLIAALIFALISVLPAYAADGKVSYDGDAQEFVFEPGGDHSLTDLFPNFKGVMPGDSLTQQITVKNDASDKVKVKIYIRSLGGHEDSVDFLSQLTLTVQTSEENEMGYMFDAAAHESAQLTDWVCLGTLFSGGEVNLDVTLNVPVELGDAFQNSVGYLDWEFMVEEFPVEDDDPQPPKTGDESNLGLWLGVMIFSLGMMIVLLAWLKKDKEKKENALKVEKEE